MSDRPAENAAPPESDLPGPAATPAPVDPQLSATQRAQAVRVVEELLQKMEVGARVEAKDAADGGIAVAVHLATELQGVQAGRRSYVIDSLQFIANKLVNRPGAERRWIAIGVGGFPEPRSARAAEKAPPPAAPPGKRPAARGASPAASPSASSPPGSRASPSVAAPQESDLEVSDDAELSAAARALAEKAVRHGRLYAVAPMTPEDRARILRAVAGIAGVRVGTEGDGRQRRLVFTPARPTPMPKSAVSDYGMQDDEGEEP